MQRKVRRKMRTMRRRMTAKRITKRGRKAKKTMRDRLFLINDYRRMLALSKFIVMFFEISHVCLKIRGVLRDDMYTWLLLLILYRFLEEACKKRRAAIRLGGPHEGGGHGDGRWFPMCMCACAFSQRESSKLKRRPLSHPEKIWAYLSFASPLVFRLDPQSLQENRPAVPVSPFWVAWLQIILWMTVVLYL